MYANNIIDADLKGILSEFEPIALNQMDHVTLQDRIDTKFVFLGDILPGLLNEIKEHYFTLEIDGTRDFQYETLYFDTEKFDLYLAHHNGRVNRYKFRDRKYVESNRHFFEVKFKNNKGRTLKNRIERPEVLPYICESTDGLVRNNSTIDPNSLAPKLWVKYHRMTFVSKQLDERLTMDTRIAFNDDHLTIPITNLVIAEVKHGHSRQKSHFVSKMRQLRVKETSISKYCLGVVSLNKDVKKNNFKPTLLHLQKLLKAS